MRVDRRKFLMLSGGLLSAPLFPAEHQIISVSPLEMQSNVASLEGRYTALEDFYVRNHHETPPNSARPLLRVEGGVAQPLRLTPADLIPLKRLQLGSVLECAGNPVSPNGLVSNGMWEGWSLKEVLDLAQPSRAAAFLHLFGRDGYARSVPLHRVDSRAMLATRLGGRPLRPNHGAPWRAFFPGWYGMDSVKWLERLVVSAAPLANSENEYMEMRPSALVGIVRSPLPQVQVKSIITSPGGLSVVQRGSSEIRGIAWSGRDSVSRVELSIDGGRNWQDTALSRGTSQYDWVLWRARVELSQPGDTELVCRATDTQGRVQPEQRDSERLDGYSQNWYHRVHVVVV